MADIELHQALTLDAQNKIVKYDLDKMVRWLTKYTLETEGGLLRFMFRSGMPGKFPNGQWGFTVVGDSGVHAIPNPDPLDHRTSFRYGEIPMYDVKLNSLYGVMAPMTVYKKNLRVYQENPERWEAIQLAAVAAALPNYFKYISYQIFKGKHNTTKANLRKYIGKYIEAADGTTNGYKFYLSDGYGEINLKKVIASSKVKEHALKKELERINKIIYKEQNKVECKLSEYVSKKAFIGKNLTAESQKTLAVYYKIYDEVRKILKEGYFDPKYKVDNTKFEGFNPRVQASDLFLIINATDWDKLQKDLNWMDSGKASFGFSDFGGIPLTNIFFNDDMDSNTAILMHKDLLQFWILPSETRYIRIPYLREQTLDIIYETMHTLDVVPIFSSMWFEFKQE